jgi:N-carbamoyl-L-amino-acid hydrolase
MVTIDAKRLEETFRRYSQIGRTDADGLHRLTLTETDQEVRDLFVEDLKSLNLDIRIDEIGNIFGRKEGTDPNAEPVLIGSHLDSQPYGGRFDGQLGVLSGLETLRTFEDAGIEHRRPIEIVNWTNEEGSRFKPALMGSGTFIGEFDVTETLQHTDSNGVTVAEALEQIGYHGNESCEPREPYDSYLELHIEQGPKLEEADLSVGAVKGVFGMAWLELTIHGDADHAGPSPMHSRRDALVAASDVVSAVRRLSNRVAADVVTTVGELEISPGSINVVPAEARLTIDVRSYDDDTVAELVNRVEREVTAACDREDVTYDLDEIWRIPHTEFSPRVTQTVLDAAETVEADHQAMVSGAGHDATYLNETTDAAMIFVPSVDGKTHNEAEYTEWEDAVAGAQTFAEATKQLASRPDDI